MTPPWAGCRRPRCPKICTVAEDRREPVSDDRRLSVGRLRAFADAVVAIAMTLLILPLMESISDTQAARGAGPWLHDHQSQLTSFALSFALITLFWVSHYRLFEQVDRVDSPLVWLTALWLLTIVWLPVATALSGRMADGDATTKIVYVGSMILTSLVLMVQRLYLRRVSDLHHVPDRLLLRGVASDVSVLTWFAIALAVMVAVPTWGYYPMFLMFFTGQTEKILDRRLGVAS